MFASLARAVTNFFDGALRGVFLRAIGLTLLLFAIAFAGLEFGILNLPTLGAPWVNRLVELLAPLLFVVAAFLLGAPVAALFASLFLDRVASTIEARAYPGQPRAVGMSTATALGAGLRLAGLALVANLGLLLLDVELAPPLPELMAIVINGWLLGREYFELAALRHMSRIAAGQLRRRHGSSVFVGGTMISLLSSVPLVNLLAPLFGAAFMVHLYMRFSAEEHAK